MPYEESPYDKLSAALSPVVRQLNDFRNSYIGTKINVLRLSKEINTFTGKNYDVFGGNEYTWQSSNVANVVIKYPFSKLELFSQYNKIQKADETYAFDFTEFLPIELVLDFAGDFEQDPVELKKGDYIVDVLKDHHGKNLPFLMEIVKMYGAFNGKHIISKTAEMTLVRGNVDIQVKNEIEKYLASLC